MPKFPVSDYYGTFIEDIVVMNGFDILKREWYNGLDYIFIFINVYHNGTL